MNNVNETGKARTHREPLASKSAATTRSGNVELSYQRKLVNDWLERGGMLHVATRHAEASQR